MAHIVSDSVKPHGFAGTALEAGATITAACVSLLMVLIPVAALTAGLAIFVDVPADLKRRLTPVLGLALVVYVVIFAVGVLLLRVGRAARHH